MTPREPARPALHVELFTEDKSDLERGCQVLCAIFLQMAKLAEPAVKTNHLHTHPLLAEPPYAAGSYWKYQGRSRSQTKQSGDDKLHRRLVKAVATALLQGHVVFFHVDGDVPWGQRHDAPVWGHLETFQSKVHRVCMSTPEATAPDIEGCFIPAVPFYSIESWLFANIAVARAHVQTQAERDHLDRWQRDLATLDQAEQVKSTLPSIETRHHHELATKSFPAADLHAAGTSFAATVTRLEQSEPVAASLRDAAARLY